MISLTDTFCDVDDFCNLYKVHRGYAILSEQNVTKFLTELRSMGKGQWDGFFGLKLHLIVNHLGNILSVK